MADTQTPDQQPVMATLVTTQHWAIGSPVRYEDMANPLRYGTITEVKVTRWGTDYRVTWETSAPGDESGTWSDLRQSGWSIG